MESLRQAWSQSKVFRVFLVLAIFWLILRIVFQLIYAAGLFPKLMGDSALPADLPVYMGAAQHFQLRQTIYPQDLSDPTYQYPYSPPFAMLSVVLLWLPARWVSILGTLISIIACILIYTQWIQIFQRLKFENARKQMAWILPVWLIFSAFWGEVAYLNIGIIVALAATLLIKCVLEERLEWAILLLTFLVISKIMWAFPVALPILFGRRRFFLKLVALTGLAYLALVGLAMLVAGPGYVIQQYGEYFNHLHRLGTEFPWHVWGETPFLGYNHSIKQIVVFIMGTKPWVLLLATAIKIVFLIPLAIVCWRLFRCPLELSDIKTSSTLRLDLIFALYLGAFIWLDIVWEVLLGIVIFAYLLATLEQRWAKGLVWSIFLLYAFVDVIQLVSYLIGGDSVIQMQGEYVLTDPSLYVPLIMMVILLFYIFLIERLCKTTEKIPMKKMEVYGK